MNSNLKGLFQQKSQWKKRRDKYLYQFYYHSIIPWAIAGSTSLVLLSLKMLIKEIDIREWFIYFPILLAIVTVSWGIYWMLKVRKCSQKLEVIDKKIAEELSGKY